MTCVRLKLIIPRGRRATERDITTELSAVEPHISFTDILILM